MDQENDNEPHIAILLPLMGRTGPQLLADTKKKEKHHHHYQMAQPTMTQQPTLRSTSSGCGGEGTVSSSSHFLRPQSYSDSMGSSSSSSSPTNSFGAQPPNSRSGGFSEVVPEWAQIGICEYVGFLGVSLFLYVGFLMLPRGMRKAYCRSERRRYVRRFNQPYQEPNHHSQQKQQHNPKQSRGGYHHGKTTNSHLVDLDLEEDEDADSIHGNTTVETEEIQQPSPPRSKAARKSRMPSPSSTHSFGHDSVLEQIEDRRRRQQSPPPPPQQQHKQHRADSNMIRSRRDAGDVDDDDDDDDESSIEDCIVRSNWERSEDPIATIRPMAIAATESSMVAHQTPSPHKQQQPPPAAARTTSFTTTSTTTTDVDRIVEDIAVASFNGAAPVSPMASSSTEAHRSQVLLQRQPQRRRPPSAEHPQIRQMPDERIWRESLRRLSSRGVRLTAHGVQCDPKRIWLTYTHEDEDDRSLMWQTEFPRQVENPETGATSIVLMRGAIHKIPLANVVYIDVGKKTSALQKTTAVVPPSSCFSLLTQQGSLDLQTNSKLERDAVVSALSYLLDEVHASASGSGADWRKLYQDTASINSSATSTSSVYTHTSTATTSVAGNGGGGALGTLGPLRESSRSVAASTDLFPLPHRNDEI